MYLLLTLGTRSARPGTEFTMVSEHRSSPLPRNLEREMIL